MNLYVRPKLFLDTNVCINVASGVVPHDEWQKVRSQIEAHYSYQISYVTVKELFARITRGEDAYFEENKKPLHVLCEVSRQEFLPYPPVFALRTVLGLELVPRREQWSDFACKAILQGFDKAQLKAGVRCLDRPGQFFKFDLDHFDKHENGAQMEHLDLLRRMQAGRVEMSDWMEMAAFLLRDCRQTPDTESCRKLANALNAA